MGSAPGPQEARAFHRCLRGGVRRPDREVVIRGIVMCRFTRFRVAYLKSPEDGRRDSSSRLSSALPQVGKTASTMVGMCAFRRISGAGAVRP